MNELNKLPIAVKIAVLLIAVLLIYKLIKKILPTQPAPSTKPAGEELGELEKKGIIPSYPNSQYSAWAEKLQYALNYANTDENAVYSVFEKLKNQADLNKLITIFGKRAIEYFPFMFQDETLSEAITSQMDGNEVQKVNGILAKKGINFNF
jgi:hypothetical protein